MRAELVMTLSLVGTACATIPPPPVTGYRHVYVAEQHGEERAHETQVEVLDALHAQGVTLEVGVEWLPREAQPALDRWVGGEISEEDLAEAVGWKKAWGAEMAGYLLVFRWAREHGVPMVGLNAPVGLARRFARGGRAGLDEADVARMPPLDTANEAQHAWFCAWMQELMGDHGDKDKHGADGAHKPKEAPPETDEEATFQCEGVPPRYYLAQVLRDEAMAQAAAERMEAMDGGTFVVLAGLGHIVFGLGIPERVRALTGEPYLTVAPEYIDPDEPAERDGRPWIHARWPD